MNLEEWASVLKNMDAWIAEAPSRYYLIYVVVDAWSNTGKHWGKNFRHVCFAVKDDYIRQSLSRKDSLEVSEHLYALNANNPDFIHRKHEEWLQKAEALQKTVQQVRETNLKELSGQELWQLLDACTRAMKEEWEIPLVYEGVQIYVEAKLIPQFQKDFVISPSESSKAFVALSAPNVESFVFQENMGLQKLALQAASHPELKKSVLRGWRFLQKKRGSFAEKVKAHSEKFFYAKTSLLEDAPLEVEHVLEAIAAIASKNTVEEIREEIRRNETNVGNIAESRKKWLEKLGLTEEWKKRFEFTAFLGEWQDERKKNSLVGNWAFFKLIREAARRNNLQELDVDRLTPVEVKALLLEGKRPTPKEFADRRAWATVLAEDGKPVDAFFGEDAKKLVSALEKQHEKADQIRGVTVSSGEQPVVRGRVRVVLDPRDKTMQNGEILVTSMTRPEFVPFMKKASAIVTNEGGVTSHAAIVSRELNISCIVGTRIATHVLKTGDLVEVNTRHGTVLVIERAK